MQLRARQRRAPPPLRPEEASGRPQRQRSGASAVLAPRTGIVTAAATATARAATVSADAPASAGTVATGRGKRHPCTARAPPEPAPGSGGAAGPQRSASASAGGMQGRFRHRGRVWWRMCGQRLEPPEHRGAPGGSGRFPASDVLVLRELLGRRARRRRRILERAGRDAGAGGQRCRRRSAEGRGGDRGDHGRSEDLRLRCAALRPGPSPSIAVLPARRAGFPCARVSRAWGLPRLAASVPAERMPSCRLGCRGLASARGMSQALLRTAGPSRRDVRQFLCTPQCAVPGGDSALLNEVTFVGSG
mmetsp:Transcript_118387/g.232468  ORF Transcript_118387/g.232468 Transcript_118387/m.232468 type:complete len:304 (+) Transcript_118387:325-1236(+)